MTTQLLVSTPVVRLAEDVEDKIYNYRPTDTPLVSSIGQVKVSAVLHEWTADTYRAPVLTNAAIEGADATFAAASQPSTYSNRAQIFQDTISVSGTAEAVKKYGRDSEVNRLKTKKMVEIKKDMEAAFIANGAAVTDNGSDTAGKARGLYGWVATNDSLGGGSAASPNPVSNTAPTAGDLRAFAEADLKTVIQAVYENGGDASVLMLSPAHKVRSSTFSGNVQRTNEVSKGGDVILQTSYGIYGHEFGQTKVVPNRVMGGISTAGCTNTAYVLDYDKIKRGVLRGFQTKQLATVGDSEQWQVLTQQTLVVGQESTLGAIRDLYANGASA
jgi:hypothetical protein